MNNILSHLDLHNLTKLNMKQSLPTVAPVMKYKQIIQQNKSFIQNNLTSSELTPPQGNDRKNQKLAQNRTNKTYGSDIKNKVLTDPDKLDSFKYNKNRSYEKPTKQKQDLNNQEDIYDLNITQTADNLSREQYRNICKNYQQNISNLHKFVEKLQKQKYLKYNNIPTILKNQQNILRSANQQTNNQNTNRNKIIKFNIQQYMERNTKQQEEAQQLLQKAIKLKQKQKKTRKLLKQIKLNIQNQENSKNISYTLQQQNEILKNKLKLIQQQNNLLKSQLTSQVATNTQKQQKLLKNQQRILQLQQKKKQLIQNQVSLDIYIRGLKNTLLKKDKQLQQLQKSTTLQHKITQQKILYLQKQVCEAKKKLQQYQTLMNTLYQQQQEDKTITQTITNQKFQIDLLQNTIKYQQQQLKSLKQQKLKLQSSYKQRQQIIKNINQGINNFKERALDYQLKYDIQISRNKSIMENLANKQLKNNQLNKIKQQQEKKIVELEKLLLDNTKIQFLEGIPFQGQNIISLDQIKQKIITCCETKIKQYNEKLFEVCKNFMLKLSQDNLIKDNNKYLELIIKFCQNLTNCSSPLSKIKNSSTPKAKVSENKHQTQSFRSTDLTFSPAQGSKQKQATLTKAKSMYLNLGQIHGVQQQQHQSPKRNIIFSNNFNDAFSHEEDDNIHIQRNQLKQNSINGSNSKSSQGDDNNQKDLVTSKVSAFSKSVHSVTQQYQAQQQYKKQMRNIKMKAKQHRRKI